MTVLPVYPSRRASAVSAASPAPSRKSAKMPSIASTPAACAARLTAVRAGASSVPSRVRGRPASAVKSSAPKTTPHARGDSRATAAAFSTPRAVSTRARILRRPRGSPSRSSTASRRAASAWTSAGDSHFGRHTPSIRARAAPRRSASRRPEPVLLTRTKTTRCSGSEPSRAAATVRRAASFSAGATPSSRSRMMASAPAAAALAIISRRCPGTKRRLRSTQAESVTHPTLSYEVVLEGRGSQEVSDRVSDPIDELFDPGALAPHVLGRHERRDADEPAVGGERHFADPVAAPQGRVEIRGEADTANDVLSGRRVDGHVVRNGPDHGALRGRQLDDGEVLAGAGQRRRAEVREAVRQEARRVPPHVAGMQHDHDQPPSSAGRGGDQREPALVDISRLDAVGAGIAGEQFVVVVEDARRVPGRLERPFPRPYDLRDRR